MESREFWFFSFGFFSLQFTMKASNGWMNCLDINISYKVMNKDILHLSSLLKLISFWQQQQNLHLDDFWNQKSLLLNRNLLRDSIFHVIQFQRRKKIRNFFLLCVDRKWFSYKRHILIIIIFAERVNDLLKQIACCVYYTE